MLLSVSAMITRLTDANRARLAGGRIGIAGAGGLGSNCAMALARAGVGHLVLLDFDAVEASNLDRQAYTVEQIGRPKVEALRDNVRSAAPACDVRAEVRRYRRGDATSAFADCDVVVEAFDDARAKTDLVEDVLENLPGVPVVAASGLAGIGGNNAIRTSGGGRFWVVGDQRTAIGSGVAVLAPRVMAVAALQANAALALLLGDGDPEAP